MHFHNIATVTIGWRAQSLFEVPIFTSRYMNRVAAEFMDVTKEQLLKHMYSGDPTSKTRKNGLRCCANQYGIPL